MKKKITGILLLTAALSMTACKNAETTSVSSSDKETASESTAVKEPESEITTTPEAEYDSEMEFLKDATIEETVLYEENGIKITATGLTYNNSSAELDISIENGADENLNFVSGSAGYSCNSVNGYMIDSGYVNCDVAAGKTANESITIGYDELLLYGINELADIEIGFEISDDNYDSFYTGPKQILTSAAETYEYKDDGYRTAIRSDALMSKYNYKVLSFDDEVISEQDGVDVLSAGFIEQKGGNTALFLEVKNTGDQDVDVEIENIYVNGLGVCSPTWSSDEIYAGKTRVIPIQLDNIMDKNIYEAYGINEFGEVSFDFSIKNTDGNDIGTRTITINNSNATAGFDNSGHEVYNANDIRIIMKNLIEDESDYSDDINVLFIVENNSGSDIYAVYSHDTLSVNSVMMDAWGYSAIAKGNSSAALKFALTDSDLQEMGISSIDDIKEMELAISIKDSQYHEIDEPVISLSMEEN